MAHETEIIVPGPFICLQGCPGDGLSNSISGRLPKLPRDDSSSMTDAQPMEGESDCGNQVVQLEAAIHPILGKLTRPSDMNGSLTPTCLIPNWNAHTSSTNAISANESSSIVTDDRQESFIPAVYTRNHKRSIKDWVRKCREKEKEQRREWRDSVLQIEGRHGVNHCMMDRFEEDEMWWQNDGRLSIFRDVPKMADNGELSLDAVGTLSPGATVVATDIIFLDSISFRPLVVPPTALNGDNNVYPKPKRGYIQIVEIEHGGRSCFTTLSLDGYWVLAPGLPGVYVDPHTWYWRVLCPAGAFLREGLELNTRHIETIPYGSLVRVSRRTVNSQGLMRLRINAKIEDRKKTKQISIDGWCSEYLNPQSGQRGVVLAPVPFPVPALYRVKLQIGAVIRTSIELSSPQIGVAPINAVLSICGRAFSEHPVDRCIERLQLAGNGGWISVRLNRPPPNDDLVVELIRVDGNYDPDNPGLYHLDAQRVLRECQQHEKDGAGTRDFEDLSSIESAESDNSRKNKLDTSKDSPNRGTSRKCLICLTEHRNATIVHGETGHVACCLVCARILKARGDKCPVCRLSIDLVIQHFWA
ncbi:unnamed protein product [Cylindrotheca closterium]|uniref:RING-type domain-containing protein n=1 Tax=Cylindrotheca closterium TaxID=2856 RepID=A0AAD2FUJ5_9STRA|nr:unnamed protein product [Cylindrotheca closterium]